MKINLQELVDKGVISEATALKIKNYYQTTPDRDSNRILLVFGVLGAVLLGLGIILILAHNWDNFSRSIKIFWAFFPLLSAQALGFYILWQKSQSKIWCETGAVLLFFAIATVISLIGQIYHIAGDTPKFLLTWLLLALSLVYIFRSYFVSLLYLVLLTAFVVSANHWNYSEPIRPWLYWGLLVVWLPYYVKLIKKYAATNFTAFHHWFVVASLLIAFGSYPSGGADWHLLAYVLLLGILLLTGYLSFFKQLPWYKNAYFLTGIIGLSGLLLFFSFDVFWLHNESLIWTESLSQIFFYIFIVLFVSWLALFLYLLHQKAIEVLDLTLYIAPSIIVIYFLSHWLHEANYLANLLILIWGVYFIVTGNKKNSLINMNFGMLLVSMLILFRFFDTDLSFILKGIIFIVLGLAFFGVNYLLVKKRKYE